MHITDDMLHRMLGVAREAYILAKRENLTEQECRNAFALGFIHGIGYEFTDTPENHRIVGFEIFQNLTDLDALKNYGKLHSMESNPSTMARILNAADLNVNAKGEFTTVRGRLAEIETNYGTASNKYRETRQLAELLGMTVK